MKRTMAVLVLGLLVVCTTARADIGPPKGLKRITVDNKIETEKEFPDYVFFLQVGRDLKEVKFDPKNPVSIPGAKRSGIGRLCNFWAVPKDAGKSYATEKEFLEAVRNSKVEGQIRAKNAFSPFLDVKDTDTRKLIVTEYKVESVDAKDGMKLVVKKEAGTGSPPPEDEDASVYPFLTRSGERGPYWLAGMFASIGLLLAGLWYAARCRRGSSLSS